MENNRKVKIDKTPPYVSDDFQIGPDGAFEWDEDEMKEFLEWDVTLMDGLEDEPFLDEDNKSNNVGDLK